MTGPTELSALAEGVFLFTPQGVSRGAWGLANCVLVTDPEGRADAALVDTPYDRRLTCELLAAIDQVLTPGTRVRTVINSHPDGDHSFGNAFFEGADIISTEAHAQGRECWLTPQQMHALTQLPTTRVLGRYVRSRFSRFDFTGITVVGPNRTFSGRHSIRVGVTPVELIEIGPAHSATDLVVHLPGQAIVAAGDVVFADDHPVHWHGPLSAVLRACRTVLDLDPALVVPGHGRVLTPAEVRSHMDYLSELEHLIKERYAKGWPFYRAAADILERGFHPDMGAPERVVIVTGAEYAHLDGRKPPHVLQLAEQAARWTYEQHLPAAVPT
ncbi:MBL fold metallo-hydrolase [Streptomyces sp. MNP-20]|uniref:MBL fold metallo-hydrolase n=1 Tax=Streptomyces sp. MNP-20 TaxID=2721165 RepID=UPI0015560FD2|nr:MBL fold metallo-hydrolase [Streptomyces sp. MNP-20]